jgi:hypothetical protein
MKGQIKTGLKAAAALLISATVSFAQTAMQAPPPYGTAPNAPGYNGVPAQRQAVPGTINYVEGQATLNGNPLGPNAVGYAIAQPNEAIDTQAGFVEVLLTPGAFLRIGHNSEVVMQSVGLANVQLRVVHGAAMVEVTDLVKGATMEVAIAGATAQLEERGLYQFDANQQLMRVLEGKAKILEASRVKTVGKGGQIVVTDVNLKSHGFDKQAAEADPLYVWSKARSAAEAQANMALARNVATYGGWYGPGWYWDPFWAEYAFLPGAGYLYSPFGWAFYSPGFVFAAPLYHPFYGRAHVSAGVYAGGFHGFAGGGFHGGHR